MKIGRCGDCPFIDWSSTRAQQPRCQHYRTLLGYYRSIPSNWLKRKPKFCKIKAIEVQK